MRAQRVPGAWAACLAAVFSLALGPLGVAQEESLPEAVEHQQEHAGEIHDEEVHDTFEEALHGNASPMLEDPSEIRASLALWTLVVFGLLMLVLWKFAWGPISEALDRREQAILSNIEEAKRQNEAAAKLLADHEAQLAGAADEVRRLLDDARRDADAQKQQILAEAQTAAQSEKQRAVQEIEAAKNGALREVAAASVDNAVRLAGKIVHRQLSPEDHASLINEALEQFPSKT